MRSNNSICYNCLHYNSACSDCEYNIEAPYIELNQCEYFSARKQCSHRIHDCSGQCDRICHRDPTEQGCAFYYMCTIDHTYCNEKCEEHKKNVELRKKKERLNKLYQSQEVLTELIKELEQEIESMNK